MPRQIYVNLPVKDLKRSVAFFTALGFAIEPRFTNEVAASIILDEGIYAMLLTEPFFATFTDKPVADAAKTTEALICLSCSSRAEVDELVAKARAAGGTVPREAQDHGFMYSHAFCDPDGHGWELCYMEPGADPHA